MMGRFLQMIRKIYIIAMDKMSNFILVLWEYVRLLMKTSLSTYLSFCGDNLSAVLQSISISPIFMKKSQETEFFTQNSIGIGN